MGHGGGAGIRMKRILLLALVLGASWSLSADTGSFKGKCVLVLDGDTVEVLKNGKPVRIRLDGIDCPEKNEPFAEEAKAFTAALVHNKVVEVVEKEKDSYGRTVARIFAGSTDVSVELLKAGLARHYRQFNKDWLLGAVEAEAKANRRGIWRTVSETPAPERATPQKGRLSYVVYHGNIRSRVFHSPSCPAYDCRNCTREFKSKEDARAAGFKPCGQCRP